MNFFYFLFFTRHSVFTKAKQSATLFRTNKQRYKMIHYNKSRIYNSRHTVAQRYKTIHYNKSRIYNVRHTVAQVAPVARKMQTRTTTGENKDGYDECTSTYT